MDSVNSVTQWTADGIARWPVVAQMEGEDANAEDEDADDPLSWVEPSEDEIWRIVKHDLKHWAPEWNFIHCCSSGLCKK